MRLIASSDPLLGVVAVLLVVGSLWLAVTRNTAFALAAYMLYLGLLDGYFKLGTGNSNVTLVRDALLYAVVAGLLIKAAVRGTPLRLPPLSTWVVMFVVIVLVEIANPTGGTIGHSIAGVRQHLEFIPLFFLGYAFVRTKRALRTFLMLLLLIAAANGDLDDLAGLRRRHGRRPAGIFPPAWRSTKKGFQHSGRQRGERRAGG